jgi:hypothetical protein
MQNLYLMGRPFEPVIGRSSDNLTVTAASAAIRVRLDAEASERMSLRIDNDGPNRVFIAWGDSSVAATLLGGLSLRPNTAETFTIPRGATHLAAIASAVGNALNTTSGYGL